MTTHHTALYTDEIHRLRSEIANLRRWSASELRDTLISSREERIAELMGCSQLADEMAECEADGLDLLDLEASQRVLDRVQGEVVEVAEVCAPAPMARELELLRAAQPKVRWDIFHGDIIGVLGIDWIRLTVSPRGWAAQVWGGWWEGFALGEVQRCWTRAEGSSLLVVVALVVSRIQAARAESVVCEVAA